MIDAPRLSQRRLSPSRHHRPPNPELHFEIRFCRTERRTRRRRHLRFYSREAEDGFNSTRPDSDRGLCVPLGHAGGRRPGSSDPDDNTMTAKVGGVTGLSVKTLRGKKKKRFVRLFFFLDLLRYYLLLPLRRTILLPLQDLRQKKNNQTYSISLQLLPV